MNKDAAEILAKLVATEEAALTEDDKAFIRARASYLTSDEASRFSFLSDAPKAKAKKSDEDSK